MNVDSLVRTDWDVVQMDAPCRRAAVPEDRAMPGEQSRAAGLEFFTPRRGLREEVITLHVPPTGAQFRQDLDSPMTMLVQKPSDAQIYDIIKNDAGAASG